MISLTGDNINEIENIYTEFLHWKMHQLNHRKLMYSLNRYS